MNPDSKQIATIARKGEVRLWNWSGRLTAKFKGDSTRVDQIVFSPDGKRIATLGADKTVRLWNLAGQQMAEYKGIQSPRAISLSHPTDTLTQLTTAGFDSRWGENTIQTVLIQDLNELLNYGCFWLKDYLTTHPDTSKTICELPRFGRSDIYIGLIVIFIINLIGITIAVRWLKSFPISMVVIWLSNLFSFLSSGNGWLWSTTATVIGWISASTFVLGLTFVLIWLKHQQRLTEIEPLQETDIKALQGLRDTVSSLPNLKRFEFETATLVRVRRDLFSKLTSNDLTQTEATLVRVRRGLFRLNEIWEIKYQQGEAEYFSEDLGNGITLEMVKIPGGQFLMGLPENKSRVYSKKDRAYYFESPQHRVSVPPFFMGKFAVTEAQYEAIMGKNLSFGANHPVNRLSWNDAVEFCDRLSQKTGRTYRLPSEAEWEYACRAGTTTYFHFGDRITTNLANFRGDIDPKHIRGLASRGEFRNQATEVGSFPPNAFGLYDMHGNVWEWCQDPWHDTYEGAPIDGSAWTTETDGNIFVISFYGRLPFPSKDVRCLRGGCWSNDALQCGSAARFWAPLNLGAFIGVRVVMV